MVLTNMKKIFKEVFILFRVFETELAGRKLIVETGKMAAEILLGNAKAEDLSVKTLVPSVSYNKELFDLLGITVPEN